MNSEAGSTKGEGAVLAPFAGNISEAKAMAWQKEIPNSLGLWHLKCFETDYAPDVVMLYLGLDGVIMADDPHLGAIALDHLANGLTDVWWAPIAAQ